MASFSEGMGNVFGFLGAGAGAYYGLWIASEQYLDNGPALLMVFGGAVAGGLLGKLAGKIAAFLIVIALAVGFIVARQQIFAAIGEYFSEHVFSMVPSLTAIV